MTCVLPVLVVSDKTLWVADYAEDGALQGAPYQVDEALLFVGRDYWQPPGVSYTVSHLHIYTRSRISEFLKEVATDEGLCEDVFPWDQLTKILNSSNT